MVSAQLLIPDAATIVRTPDEQSLANLLEKVTQRLDAGEHVNVDELARSHPQHAARLRELMPTMVAMASWGRIAPGHIDERQSDTSRSAIAGVLGDFRILGELGRGGMGTVFEAEQISMGRKVALKVLPFAALAQPRALQRFRNEVRAAAALDHPHIVPVYSVGEERGIHYYSMQLIRGQSLATVIQELRETLRPRTADPDRIHNREEDPTIDSAASGPQSTKRDVQAALSTVADPRMQAERFRTAARLGIQAAEALQHAHDQGVLHRDIKPGNLMLDANGDVYVTDFGLARIEADAGMTMTGDIVGTLRYMAPEQALAKRVVIDHRADIYSLGATLYELLTLQPAFAETERSDLLKQIAFEDPAPLRKIDRQIPAELETIVLKAMEKNPDERYQTAEQLGADLRAYLDDKPITAKPPRLAQRAMKWSRRHQVAVLTAMALVLLSSFGLAIGAGLIWREQQKTVAALERASQKAVEADAVVNFLVNELLGAASPAESLGQDLTVAQVLANAEKKIGASLTDQPVVEAAIRYTLGDTLSKLGQYAAAQHHFTCAVELRTAHLGREHIDTLKTMNGLASTLRRQGMFHEAQKLYQEGLEIERRVLGPEHPVTLTAMSGLASAFLDQQKVHDAMMLFQETLGIQRRVLGPDHPETLTAMDGLASTLFVRGELEEAEYLYRETLEIRRRMHGSVHPDTLTSMSNLAVSLDQQKKVNEAQRLFQETFDIQRRVLGPEHPNTLLSLQNLGKSLRGQGKRDQAQKLYLQSRASLRSIAASAGMHGRWEEAAEVWSQVIQHNVNTNRFGEEEGLDCVQYGCVLIRGGDLDKYDQFRQVAIAGFTMSNNPITLERVARACLLSPADLELLGQMDSIYQVLLTNQQEWKARNPDLFRPWGCLALALLEYRRGQWAASLEWSEKVVAAPKYAQDDGSYLEAMSRLIRAMNHHKLGEGELATADLHESSQIISQGYTPGQWSPRNHSWHDWEFAWILRDEAKELIHGQPTK